MIPPQPDYTISDDELEFLFRPSTMGELLCRLQGIESFQQLIWRAVRERIQSINPAYWHRIEGVAESRRVICREKIYQEEKRRRLAWLQ